MKGYTSIPMITLVLGALLVLPTISQILEVGHAVTKCISPRVKRALIPDDEVTYTCNGVCKSSCGPHETNGSGSCPSGCRCCKPKLTVSCGGVCWFNGFGGGYCTKLKPFEYCPLNTKREVRQDQLSIIPTCSNGCTCCPN
ncbi:unnamed protein product [Meganyctiphanes norvegica]|uniref:Uncharacterized protein n=1 Tax=Meganyctiphanes norvegica TaxID=48144 RepID=A0AAV2QSR9_MEGNR